MSVSSLGLFFIVVFITCITPGAGVSIRSKTRLTTERQMLFSLPQETLSACYL